MPRATSAACEAFPPSDVSLQQLRAESRLALANKYGLGLGRPVVISLSRLHPFKGLEYLVDIHIEVDPGRTVAEGHAIAHAVKDRLIRRVPAIRDVLVHVEPHHEGRGG